MMLCVKLLSTVPEDVFDCRVTAPRYVACHLKLTKKLREIIKHSAMWKVNTSKNLEYRVKFCTNFFKFDTNS